MRETISPILGVLGYLDLRYWVEPKMLRRLLRYLQQACRSARSRQDLPFPGVLSLLCKRIYYSIWLLSHTDQAVIFGWIFSWMFNLELSLFAHLSEIGDLRSTSYACASTFQYVYVDFFELVQYKRVCRSLLHGLNVDQTSCPARSAPFQQSSNIRC